MNSPQGDASGPRIDIHVRPGGIEIRQQRPAIVASLVGKPVAAALQLVPALLPICGKAQSVAASRAVTAARMQVESTDQQVAYARQLWWEQALAAAWRCTIDWPDLLGEPRQLATLKRVRQAKSERELGAMLQQLVPGLEDITGIDGLLDWVGKGSAVPARVAHQAMDTGQASGGWVPLTVSGLDTLQHIAANAFAQEAFDALDPEGSPREVGPLAMSRDALIAELHRESVSPVLARILAQVLDMRVIYRALCSGTEARSDSHGWSAQPGIGIAMTARGPVFHRVRLDPADPETVADWRVLAPTDWHFGPRGPVVRELRELGELASPAAMRLLIASFDPCAPWSLHTEQGDG